MPNQAGPSCKLIVRRLVCIQACGVTLLDAVESIGEKGVRQVSLFFGAGTNPEDISFAKGWEIVATGGVGEGLWYVAESKNVGPLELNLASERVQIDPAKAELDLLSAANAAVAVRNGECADTVLTWLKYHCTSHGMNAAVILNRAKPDTDEKFLTTLKNGLRKAKFSCDVVVLDAVVPLGKVGLPPEAHPYCAPAAPGKDRMVVPAPDPWSSPFGTPLFYEIARVRHLSKARAVANIDVSDLLAEDGDGNIFDRADESAGGVISILGTRCYPWRIRKDKPIHFADHICIQFDNDSKVQKWCIAPARAPEKSVWRAVRVGNATPDRSQTARFYRFMALRHPERSVSKIVPKSSLVEHRDLLRLSQYYFKHKPVRAPKLSSEQPTSQRDRCVIVTTMKNEGPFILEWLAYHRAIGFDDFLVYSNDCTDGTDSLLDLLQSKGFLQHRNNPFRSKGLKPQHAALQAAEKEQVIKNSKWVVCIDVDEYINIKVGAGTLDDLFTVIPDANMISMTWRLFGNADIHAYADRFITEQFTRCAPELARKPHQAWGFKTLFQNIGLFKKLGVHRPKGLNAQLVDQINWVNGSGEPLPRNHYRNAWRSTVETYGYDLVSLNHYAVRSAESFLVKRDRGRVNHVDRDQGLAYWFRMNNNAEVDHSIASKSKALMSEYDAIMADEEIAAMHADCVRMHQEKIRELLEVPHYAEFYAALTSQRLEKLSRMHVHFGANVFLAGPEVIPDEILSQDPDETFFFTVSKRETTHE
ncbi:glycosyltransferase family 2 protein [Pseudohalocynthiibacter sp. F2068]|jgi:Glycosyl transferase family 2|uniref:glycosyltransferase family 2 protein n=1 Tax=Pseudohalocynthiibacter sp. F2068 TaxID=2926418 RepID=UPI001FF2B24A|nr:glycosyltransferase family 2 protein [Pseudohalocynthiibacter sp. F2068]